MGVDTRSYYYWLETRKGKHYRRKRGKIVYELEDITLDHSYAKHYNFVLAYPVLRRLDNGRRVGNVPLSDFEYDFVEVEESA